MTSDVAIEPLAEDTLLLRFGDGIDIGTNARVHAAARAVRAARLPGLIDVAPAYASLMLRFDPAAWLDDGPNGTYPCRLMEALRALLEGARATDAGHGRDDGQATRPRQAQRADGGARAAEAVEIPVCYGGDRGPDLAAVAEHAHLTSEQVVTRHAAAEYTVAMLGFAPGFPYLLGLDPALATPRRANPRTRVSRGSVAIGGAQTGIYPRELPGGWWLIGRTPRVLFDPLRDPPCLLAPGDRVRFRPISADEFARLAKGVA